MGTAFNTQIANGSFVEEGTVSQAKWQNRNEKIMAYVKVSLVCAWRSEYLPRKNLKLEKMIMFALIALVLV